MDELGIADLIEPNPTTKSKSDWDIEILSDKPWANHSPSTKIPEFKIAENNSASEPKDNWFDKLIDEITEPKKSIPWYEDTLENNCPSRRRKALRMPKTNNKKL